MFPLPILGLKAHYIPPVCSSHDAASNVMPYTTSKLYPIEAANRRWETFNTTPLKKVHHQLRVAIPMQPTALHQSQCTTVPDVGWKPAFVAPSALNLVHTVSESPLNWKLLKKEISYYHMCNTHTKEWKLNYICQDITHVPNSPTGPRDIICSIWNLLQAEKRHARTQCGIVVDIDQFIPVESLQV